MAVKSLAQSSLVEPQIRNSMLAGYESNYFHHLETVRLSSTAASVTFSNLARYSDFQHLQIRYVVKTGRASLADDMVVRFNGDSATNYTFHSLIGPGSSAPFSSGSANMSGIYGYSIIAGGTSAAQIYSPGVLDILDPFETVKNTTTRQLIGTVIPGQTYIMLHSGVWRNTSAIDSINLSPISGNGFLAGSRFSLYGIKARA